jgi:SRSO17 transposase
MSCEVVICSGIVYVFVEGFMDELQEFQSVFHDCFARSEARAHCLDYMVGQYSPLPRKSIEPMALAVEGSRVRSLQRFLGETVWDEEHKPRQRILYAGAELNRLYPECSISMSNHAV